MEFRYIGQIRGGRVLSITNRITGTTVDSWAGAEDDDAESRGELTTDRFGTLATELVSHRCPWCESVDRPARLQLRSYPHENGLPVNDGSGRISRHWIYGVCESCGHEWSLVQLRRDKEWVDGNMEDPYPKGGE